MKQSFSLVLLFFCTISFSSAHVSISDLTIPSNKVEQIPNRNAEFPGGLKALAQYLATHISYTEEARENGFEGTVSVKFTVNPNGTISDIEILRSPSPLLSSSAQAVVEGMPAWKPAIRNGDAVKKQVILPIQFSLK